MRDRVHEGLSKRNGGVVVVVDPLEAYKLGPVVVMGLEERIGVGELLENRALVLTALGEHAPAVIGERGGLHRRGALIRQQEPQAREGTVRIEHTQRPHLSGLKRKPPLRELRLRIAKREVLVHRETGFEHVSLAFANHADDGGIACGHARGARANVDALRTGALRRQIVRAFDAHTGKRDDRLIRALTHLALEPYGSPFPNVHIPILLVTSNHQSE